jgi:hypothetical protein
MRRIILAVLAVSAVGCSHARYEGDVECSSRGAAHTWGNSGTTTVNAKTNCHTVTAQEAAASQGK